MEGDTNNEESMELLKQKIVRLEASRTKLREGLSMMREKAINTQKLMGKYKEHAERCKDLENENQSLLQRLSQEDNASGDLLPERERQLKTEYELRISVLQETITRLESRLKRSKTDLSASWELVESTKKNSEDLVSKIESLSLSLKETEKALSNERLLRQAAEARLSEGIQHVSPTQNGNPNQNQGYCGDNLQALETAIHNHWDTLRIITKTAGIEIGPADSSAILMKHCVKPHRDRQSERVTDSETRGLPESGDQSQGRSARILEVATGNTTGSSSSGSTMEDSSRESPQVLPEAKKLEGGSRKRKGNWEDPEPCEARSKRTEISGHEHPKESGISASSTQTENGGQIVLNQVGSSLVAGAVNMMPPQADISRAIATCSLSRENSTTYNSNTDNHAKLRTCIKESENHEAALVSQPFVSLPSSMPALSPAGKQTSQVYSSTKDTAQAMPRFLKDLGIVHEAIQNVGIPPHYVKRNSRIIAHKIVNNDHTMVKIVSREITSCLIWTLADPVKDVLTSRVCDKNVCLGLWQKKNTSSHRLFCALIQLTSILAKSKGCHHLPWVLWSDVTRIVSSYLKLSSETFMGAYTAAGAAGHLCSMLNSKQLLRVFCMDLLMLAGRSDRSTLPILFVFLYSCPEILSKGSKYEESDRVILSVILGLCENSCKAGDKATPKTKIDYFAATELLKLGIQHEWWNRLGIPQSCGREPYVPGTQYGGRSFIKEVQSVFEKMKLLLGEPQELDSKSVWQAEFEKATEAIALALVSMDPAMAFKVISGQIFEWLQNPELMHTQDLINLLHRCISILLKFSVKPELGLDVACGAMSIINWREHSALKPRQFLLVKSVKEVLVIAKDAYSCSASPKEFGIAFVKLVELLENELVELTRD